jgi:hypothetical protein
MRAARIIVEISGQALDALDFDIWKLMSFERPQFYPNI